MGCIEIQAGLWMNGVKDLAERLEILASAELAKGTGYDPQKKTNGLANSGTLGGG